MGVGERVQRLHHQCRGFDREELPADVSLPLSGVLFSFSPFFFFFFFASSQSFAAHSFTKCLFYVVPAPGDGMGHTQEQMYTHLFARCLCLLSPSQVEYWFFFEGSPGQLSCFFFNCCFFLSFLTLFKTSQFSFFALDSEAVKFCTDSLYSYEQTAWVYVNILISRVQHVIASANHVAGLTTPFPCLGVPSSLVIS